MCKCVHLSEDLTIISVRCVQANLWRIQGKSQAGLSVSLLNVVKLAACVFLLLFLREQAQRKDDVLFWKRAEVCKKKKKASMEVSICWADRCGICPIH